VVLSNPAGVAILDGEAIGTIQNDDTTLRIGDVSVAESDSGFVEATLTVTLSAAVDFEVVANLATANASAGGGSDYLPLSRLVRFAPGQTSQTVSVLVIGDRRDEADETFFVNLSAPTSAILADGQGVVTIRDDDALPTMTIEGASIVEGSAGTKNLNFTVRLSQASGRTVSATYATQSGTAAAGSDFQSKSGTVSFFAGTTAQAISIPVFGDAHAEISEAFSLVLSSPINAALGTSQAVGTILDDDSLTISDASVVEGDDGAVFAEFTVALAAAQAQEVRVDYATANGTAAAGSDYAPTSGTLVFASGQTTHTIRVPVAGDRTDEADETIVLQLANATGIVLGDSQAVATIIDDDASPQLLVSDVRLLEGNSGTRNLAFTVRLSAASGRSVSVEYATADATATAGVDYVARSGTLTFLPGWTTQTVYVAINGDDAIEADEELLFQLLNPSGASLGTSQGVGTILNDDQTSPSDSGASAAASADEFFAELADTESDKGRYLLDLPLRPRDGR
jgi:hypothetical protein